MTGAKNYHFNFRAVQTASLDAWTHSEYRELKKMADLVQIWVALPAKASFYT